MRFFYVKCNMIQIMNPCIISVIVPVYNAEKNLHRCIDSILAQTYTFFELLLIDDGSPDRSGVICDEYAGQDSRVRVFHKENGGVSSARNLALDSACGKYIAFCDADDYVGENWLKSFIEGIVNNVDLVIQGIHYITNNGEIETKRLAPYWGNGVVNKRNLIVQLMQQGVYGYPVTKLFRKEIIEENHIRFDANSTFREDEQFLSKYLEYVTSFSCIDRENYYYILPTSEKMYGGDAYYSLFPVFESLDVIYNRELPYEICKLHYVNIKDAAAKYIAEGRRLTDSHIDLYRRMVTTLEYTRGIKNRILNFLIIQSPKFGSLSRMAICLIQKK